MFAVIIGRRNRAVAIDAEGIDVLQKVDYDGSRILSWHDDFDAADAAALAVNAA